MSTLDKIIAAVAPPESKEKRAEAHAKARQAAHPGGWLSQILDHHERIEQAFAGVRAAGDPQSRRDAQKALGALLNGHAMAEEAVIYPGLAQAGKSLSSNTAYMEQIAAKMQMAQLERLDPMSRDYMDKLEHLESAVQHHVFKEESEWFIDLSQKAPASDQALMTKRYSEEFGRYMGEGPDGLGEGARGDWATRVSVEHHSFHPPAG